MQIHFTERKAKKSNKKKVKGNDAPPLSKTITMHPTPISNMPPLELTPLVHPKQYLLYPNHRE